MYSFLEQTHFYVCDLLLINTIGGSRMMDDKRLFFNWINYIEVEISSLCNRKCDYCPSSKAGRNRELLKKDLFIKILNQLEEIEYAGSLAFHQYNEPLLEYENLIDCVRLAREIIPNARLILYTNGDYLTREKYDLLIAEGIIEFHISCHLEHGEIWSQDMVTKKIKAMKKKIGLKRGGFLYEANRVTWHPTRSDELMYKLKAYRMKEVEEYPVLTYIMSTDFYAEGSKRMGKVAEVRDSVINKSPRTYFCPCILSTLNISYKGNSYLCWDCCEGCESDMQYYIGNIEEDTIFQLYRKKMNYIQKYLSRDGLECCVNCFWNNL